jgi:hypothetical protein
VQLALLSMGRAVRYPDGAIARKVSEQFSKAARHGEQNDLLFAAVFRNILRTDPDLLS